MGDVPAIQKNRLGFVSRYAIAAAVARVRVWDLAPLPAAAEQSDAHADIRFASQYDYEGYLVAGKKSRVMKLVNHVSMKAEGKPVLGSIYSTSELEKSCKVLMFG